ncbi:MAG: response regulator [Fuerstiella sp.]
MAATSKPIHILLIEDSETDAELTMEALVQGKIRNTVDRVRDGEEALKYLRMEDPYPDAPRPDLILLDLNMPRMDGREFLKIVDDDEKLRIIPIVVLTTSTHDVDVMESYGMAANNYIVKPVDLNQFFTVIQDVQNFWVQVVTLPPRL